MKDTIQLTSAILEQRNQLILADLLANIELQASLPREIPRPPRTQKQEILLLRQQLLDRLGSLRYRWSRLKHLPIKTRLAEYGGYKGTVRAISLSQRLYTFKCPRCKLKFLGTSLYYTVQALEVHRYNWCKILAGFVTKYPFCFTSNRDPRFLKWRAAIDKKWPATIDADKELGIW